MKNKSKHYCPHCHRELNLGSLVAKARWDNTTKKKKDTFISMLNQKKKEKKI